jgi:hypothetical protein
VPYLSPAERAKAAAEAAAAEEARRKAAADDSGDRALKQVRVAGAARLLWQVLMDCLQLE